VWGNRAYPCILPQPGHLLQEPMHVHLFCYAAVRWMHRQMHVHQRVRKRDSGRIAAMAPCPAAI